MARAMVIRTYGDREIAGAIVDGIVRDVPRPDSLRRVAMHQHTPEEWAAMIEQARYDYGQDMEHGRLYNAIWGIIGTVVLAVDGWYEMLAAWNRGGET